VIKVLSLFSGIGAFEKALQNLKIPYELVGYSEIDKFASYAYSVLHNVPESMNLGDVTKINLEILPKDIDLITYGFPCQPFSNAGLQQGFEDSKGRGNLFFDALRIIKHCKPKIAIAENVKNLATSERFKNEFQIILNSLDEAGYNCYHKVLDGIDYTVPQHRERIIIVSIRKDIDTGIFEFPEPVELKKCLYDYLQDEPVDEKYYVNNDKVKALIPTLKNKKISGTIRGGGARSLDKNHQWDLVIVNKVQY
jgi:DNA (cytosine-5)-methyltransferase 1